MNLKFERINHMNYSPYIIIIPDEQQVLEDGQEVGFWTCVFHHVGQEMIHLTHIGTQQVKEKALI